ncbi:unnamed protein product, partial [Musa hybrid cultivar]
QWHSKFWPVEYRGRLLHLCQECFNSFLSLQLEMLLFSLSSRS